MSKLYLRFVDSATEFGGVTRVNRAIAEILRGAFPVVADAGAADLQVCASRWDAPHEPTRFFVDHGSFADGEFWLCHAPRLRPADTILVSSRVCVEVAERILDSPRPALALVPYFADTERFRAVPDRVALRRELRALGVPSEGPLLVTIAAYSRRKNLDLGIRFLHELDRCAPGARLAMVGRPQPSQQGYADELRHLGEELGVDDRVHVLPMMPHRDLARLLAAADLLVHLTTCRLENFGLVVAEAMAAGLPVVAADWGGLRDLVVDDETGLLAPTFISRNGPRVDWRSTVGRGVELLDDRSRWEAMSARGVELARERLSLESFARRLEAAVTSALERPGLDQPVRFTTRGQALVAAAGQVNLMHRGPRSQGQDYQALLELDDGEHARCLLGPAATREEPPRVDSHSRLYPAVDFSVERDRVRITDPGWIGERDLDVVDSSLLLGSDGRRKVAELRDEPVPARDAVERVQRLVDRGALCPLGK